MSTDISIRAYEARDWAGTWQILEPVFRAGETFPMAQDITEADSHAHWIEHTQAIFVAVDVSEETVIGTYDLKPNSAALGAHVCNAGYMVAESARRQGVAEAMARHSLQMAAAMGFRAMQFNLVVTSNEASVRLWQKLEFEVVGVLPGAFKHARLGYVDALVLYKMLVEGGAL